MAKVEFDIPYKITPGNKTYYIIKQKGPDYDKNPVLRWRDREIPNVKTIFFDSKLRLVPTEKVTEMKRDHMGRFWKLYEGLEVVTDKLIVAKLLLMGARISRISFLTNSIQQFLKDTNEDDVDLLEQIYSILKEAQ